MEVRVHPKTFLERLRLAGSLTGKRYPSPVLETVQLEVTDAQSSWLRATNGQAAIELLAVGTDGRVIAHATEPGKGSGLVAPQTTIVGGEERTLAPVVLMKPLKTLVSALEGIENAELELAFTAGERFQAKAKGIFFAVSLPEGRFPSSWHEVFPESASYGCRVDDPSRLAKALRDMRRFTVQGSRSIELCLSGHSLTLSVQNDEAKAQTQVTVRNLSQTRDEAATTIDPEYLLRFLEASGQPFDLWFPQDVGTPLVCRGEAHHYALMPMERPDGPPTQTTGDQSASVQAATEEPPRCPQEEPPAVEAQTRRA